MPGQTFFLVLNGCCLLMLLAFGAGAQPMTFTTFVGSEGGSGSADGTGSVARFNEPQGIAVDSRGNMYVADSDNETIRMITPAGVVTTFAGSEGLSGRTDGTGAAARFSLPTGLTTDSSGNVYVADMRNHTIRKITPGRVVTTLAGWPGAAGSNDGVGSDARFFYPQGVAADGEGNIYVADTGNDMIRKINPAGEVTTLAGSRFSDGSVDGTGGMAGFSSPQGIATDRAGNIYVADTGSDSPGSTIRKITPTGVVTTLAGSPGLEGSQDGTGSAARFRGPAGLTVDDDGNVYVADTENSSIRKITKDGVVTTFAGGETGISPCTLDTLANCLAAPEGVAIDTDGNVYVADTSNSTIRKISPAGRVTTLAGTASLFGFVDGTGSAAGFVNPVGVATDLSGNLYVSDTFPSTIRKITPDRVVTTLAGTALLRGSADGTGAAARFNFPWGMATDLNSNIYVTDLFNDTIRKITPGGVVTTLAGSPGVSGSADGTGSDARFSSPYGVATDNDLNVYVADAGNSTIRKISPAGAVTTLAGSAGLPGSADGTGSEARFRSPVGVAADRGGNVYVADGDNHTIRKITPAGVVTTLAGSPLLSGNTDGFGKAARFYGPGALAIDPAGDIYVADSFNNMIRKITPEGVVTTVAGRSRLRGNVEGTGSTARFSFPSGVAIDSGGSVFVVGAGNSSISVGRLALADTATIDLSTGPVGLPRQLDATANTATSWQWSIVRQPSGSKAMLSSVSIRNPIFTPDVADLYTFQLIASNGVNTSITTVSLTSTPGASRRRAVVR